jgi:hypothetical protein
VGDRPFGCFAAVSDFALSSPTERVHKNVCSSRTEIHFQKKSLLSEEPPFGWCAGGRCWVGVGWVCGSIRLPLPFSRRRGGWVVRCDQNARHSRSAPASGAISNTRSTRPPFPAAPPAALILGAFGITGRTTLRKYPFRLLNALTRMDAHSFSTDLRREPPD